MATISSMIAAMAWSSDSGSLGPLDLGTRRLGCMASVIVFLALAACAR